MAKEKTISIKPYLNSSKQSESDHYVVEDENGNETKGIALPLYYLVVFNRQNTKMKSSYYSPVFNVVEGDIMPKKLIGFETKLIEKAIRYESFKDADKFQMKGFPDRFAKYSKSTSTVIELYLKDRVRFGAMKTFKEIVYNDLYKNFVLFIGYNDPKLEFEGIYNVFAKLYENFNQYLTNEDIETIEAYSFFAKVFTHKYGEYDFTTVIDWLSNESKNIFRDQLLTKFKLSNMKAEMYIERIDKAIKKQIEKPS